MAHSLRIPAVEWPTLGLVVAVHACWMLVTAGADTLGPWLTAPLLTMLLVLHSSVQHEMIHGHPFRNQALNDALAIMPLGLFIPYNRFRDTHLAHHRSHTLTCPHRDPESAYVDPATWRGLPVAVKMLMHANNTLAGRIVFGPLVSQFLLVSGDLRRAWSGEPGLVRAWVLHAAGLVPVIWWLSEAGEVPWWMVLATAYAALSILKIRTYAEHRAHPDPHARSCVVENGGLLGLLFLNNHLHALHHAEPELAWYRLPARYRDCRPAILHANDGYRFKSYSEVFRRYLARPRDQVPHPLPGIFGTGVYREPHDDPGEIPAPGGPT